MPGGEEVADAGQGVAALLEAPDQLQPVEVGSPVVTDASPLLRRRQEPHGLVLRGWWVSDADEGVDGRAFMVMDLAAGRPLLAGLDGVAAVKKLPSLARRRRGHRARLVGRAARGGDL